MDFSTTVLFSPSENNRYQAIYASQRYGTFYGLFGKFHIEKRGKKTFLHGIESKLLNYKGILNISIETDDDSVALDAKAKELNRGIPVMLLKVKVRARIQDPNYEGTLKLLNPIEIKEGTFFSVITDFIPLGGQKDIPAAYVDGVFDNEFFYRDGVSHVQREITDIDPDHGDPRIPDGTGYRFQSELLSNLDNRFGSFRCTVGNSKIVV